MPYKSKEEAPKKPDKRKIYTDKYGEKYTSVAFRCPINLDDKLIAESQRNKLPKSEIIIKQLAAIYKIER